METIDARGLSCPEPVLMVKRAIESNESEYEVMVDNVVSVENIKRFVINHGYKDINIEESQSEYRILIRR